MRTRNLGTSLGILLLAAAACSSSGKAGTIAVHLVDGPGDYQQINLHVLRVEVHSDVSGWTTLSSPDRTYDLLTLRGGVFATLASGVQLPAGDYTQVRLVLGAGNTVKLADGTVEDLKVPSGLQSGLKIVCHARMEDGASRDVFIDFDGHRSIFLHGTGSGRYLLRPVIRCADKVTTGSITGRLTSTATESVQPLAGVAVTAQALDAAGNPSVVRTATTGIDGRYTLDLLPLGATYFVVAAPVDGAAVYAARASGPLALTAAAPAAGFDLAYSTPVPAGAAAGAITPVAGAADVDEVRAVQPLDAGATTHLFVIRSAPGSVASGAESYGLPSLPVGSYALSVARRTLSTPTETVTVGAARTAVIAANTTTTVDLTVP